MYGEWFNNELMYETFAKTNNVMLLIYEEMKMVHTLQWSKNYIFTRYALIR